MGLLRSAARLLDVWGALILGVAVVLAVIMLLAMPGPWREVVGGPPAAAPADPPRDVVVFVRSGADDEDCTAAVWLHVEHERPSLTAVVVPVQLQVAAPGAGFDRLCRVFRLFGGEAAAAALGESLGVSFAGSVSLTVEGLSAAVPTMFPEEDSPRARHRRRVALRTWTEHGPAIESFRRMTRLLDEALPRVPFETLSVVAVANYALGSEYAQSDLGLQEATTLAERVREVRPEDVVVRALPVVREVRGEGVFWRPNRGATDRLAASLRLGLRPPRDGVDVTTVERPGGVVVALPAHMDALEGVRFATALRGDVRDSAGRSLGVAVRHYGAGGLSEALTRSVARERPLAVVLVAPLESARGDGDQALREVVVCAARLKELYQPAVLVAPVAAEAGGGPEVASELEATGLPLVAVPIGGGDATPAASPTVVLSPRQGDAWWLRPDDAGGAGLPDGICGTWQSAGSLAAATAVRACWPAVLAPGLAGTRRGVTYAERRSIELGLLEDAAVDDLVTWLAACGYRSAVVGDGWTPQAAVAKVVYQPGLRRLALAVAGDLGLPAAFVAEDDAAPAPITVVP